MASRDRDRSKSRKRKENIREEKKTVLQRELITFNFMYLDETQPVDAPESIASWNDLGLLKPLMARLKEISKLTRDEACKQQLIKNYGAFPSADKTKFSHPAHVDDNVSWAVLKSIGGQIGTVAGFIVENTFYVVFFDRLHQFWITEKKHT